MFGYGKSTRSKAGIFRALGRGFSGTETCPALALAALCLALVSCTAEKIPLKGERVSVFSFGTPPESPGAKIVLARPYVNESWASASGNARNSKGHLAGRKDFSERVRADIGVNYETSPILYPPVADGDAIFTIDGNLHVSKLSLKDGSRIWHNTDLSNGQYLRFGALAYMPGALFALANDSTLARIDPATGRTVYSKNFGPTAKSGLQVCGGRVYFSSDEGELFALDASTGEKVFGHRTIEEPFGFMRGSTPACEGGRIVAAFPNGEVHMLMDSEPIWLAALLRPKAGSVNSMPDIVANPVIEGGVAIAKSYTGRTAAFDLKDGRELWSRPNGGTATPVASNGIMFDVDSNGLAFALDISGGKTIWSAKLDVPKGASALSPLLVNNRLLVAFTNGMLAKIDPYGGTLVSMEKIAPKIDVPPIYVGDALVVISNGNLEIFR